MRRGAEGCPGVATGTGPLSRWGGADGPTGLAACACHLRTVISLPPLLQDDADQVSSRRERRAARCTVVRAHGRGGRSQGASGAPGSGGLAPRDLGRVSPPVQIGNNSPATIRHTEQQSSQYIFQGFSCIFRNSLPTSLSCDQFECARAQESPALEGEAGAQCDGERASEGRSPPRPGLINTPMLCCR